jgi:hypothetical protein
MLMGKGFLLSLAVLAETFWVSATSAQKQFPIMDKLANRVIQKYQQSSCEQLKARAGSAHASTDVTGHSTAAR